MTRRRPSRLLRGTNARSLDLYRENVNNFLIQERRSPASGAVAFFRLSANSRGPESARPPEVDKTGIIG